MHRGWGSRHASGRAMTDAPSKKEGFKKCRSATFSIDGYSFTIGENFPALPPPPIHLAWARTLSGGGEGAVQVGGAGRPAARRLTGGSPGSGDRAGESGACGRVARGVVPAPPPPSEPLQSCVRSTPPKGPVSSLGF